MGFGKRSMPVERLPRTKVNKKVSTDFCKHFSDKPSATLIVGIDPGLNTGFSIFDQAEGELTKVCSMMIHEAFAYILLIKDQIKLVRFEDARQRKKFGERSDSKLQGAGSIKRDSKIWEDFLTSHKINFQMIAPVNIRTKVDADRFKTITGWDKPTNNHGRDAAMIVYGYG